MPSGEAPPGPLLRLLDTLLNKLAGHGLLPDLTGLLQSGVPGVAPVQLAGTPVLGCGVALALAVLGDPRPGGTP